MSGTLTNDRPFAPFGFSDRIVLAAAERIGQDKAIECPMMPPCAATDAECRCLRLAKTALGVDRDITAAHDATADQP